CKEDENTQIYDNQPEANTYFYRYPQQRSDVQINKRNSDIPMSPPELSKKANKTQVV
ncbi:hypothetical protein COCCADRAFT_94303, partial [Bipolaris zeicola 26-R-13]